MKGFSGNESCGVRIKNAHVKGRFDVVILGFANDREKSMFVNTVSNALQPAAPEVRTLFLVCHSFRKQHAPCVAAQIAAHA